MNVFAVSLVNAQACDPDMTLPDSVVISPLPYTEAFPDQGIQDTACVNSYFETVLTFNIPATYEFNGGVVPLGYIAIAEEGGINNLPASFSYACNPPNCQFRGDTTGCLVIYGTGAEGDIGEHDLTMNATFNVGGFNLSQELPGAVIDGHYYFNVQPEGSPNCTIVEGIGTLEQVNFSIANHPNPTDGYTEFVIDSQEQGTFDLSIHDLLGRALMNQKVNVLEGVNTLPFDASGLAPGLYIYTLRKDEQSISGRLLVARQ